MRALRFHDLRHTFGTRVIGKADIRRVQEWMGRADIQTTMRYLHYAPREEDARLVAEAFEIKPPSTDDIRARMTGHLSASTDILKMSLGRFGTFDRFAGISYSWIVGDRHSDPRK